MTWSRVEVERTSKFFNFLLGTVIFLLGASPALAVTELRLTTSDVIRMVFQNNTKIELAVIDYRISQAEAFASNVDFDSIVTLAPSYKQEMSYPNSILDQTVINEKTAALSLGVKRKFSLGTELELTYQDLRILSDSLEAVLRDRYQSAGQVKLTQPLLKGLGKAANMAVYRKSQIKSRRFWAQLGEAIDDSLSRALELFLDLYKANSEVEVKISALKTAKEQLEEVLARYRVGTKSIIDVLAARSKVELSQAALLLARANVEDAEEKLAKEILPLKKESYLSSVSIVPVMEDKWEFPEKLRNYLDHPEDIPEELKENIKLQRMALEKEESAVDLNKSANGLLPHLNLELTYLSTGMASSFNEAHSNMLKFINPGYTVMINFSIPLGNNAANGDYQRSSASVATKEAQISVEKENIHKNFLVAVRDLYKNYQTLESMRSRIKLSERLAKVKRQLYLNGRIRVREYNIAIDDYNDAQSSQNQLLADFYKGTLKINTFLGQLAVKEKKSYLSKISAR